MCCCSALQLYAYWYNYILSRYVILFYKIFSIQTNSEVSLSAPQKLYKDLFKNYYKGLRPIFNHSQPMSVAIHFWFKQILKVDEIDQTLTVYCWLEVVRNNDKNS